MLNVRFGLPVLGFSNLVRFFGSLWISLDSRLKNKRRSDPSIPFENWTKYIMPAHSTVHLIVIYVSKLWHLVRFWPKISPDATLKCHRSGFLVDSVWHLVRFPAKTSPNAQKTPKSGLKLRSENAVFVQTWNISVDSLYYGMCISLACLLIFLNY